MLGRKTNSQTRPTALGTLLNNSSYGATIPNIYGTTRASLFSIWAANLRNGNSGKKGKGKSKKQPPTYVENVDFLLGSNPIEGCLQVWANNANRYTLNFTSVRFAPYVSGSNPYIITDAHFYFLIGITAEVVLSGTFNDYGAEGSLPYSGTYEYPLWNLAQHGPDLINSNASREWPYVYHWVPGSPNVIFPQNFLADSTFGIPGGNGYVNLYYAQLNSSTKLQPPITHNRLAFEQILGSGTEYADASLAAQQILYPYYAGLGSSDIDLGTSGMLPDFRVEVKGSFARYSKGDCDFSDMLEDVIKSGMMQTGAELGLIQRGLNCNEIPGPVQKVILESLEPNGTPTPTFYQPNRAGSILLAFAAWRIGSGAAPSISDTAGDTWTPVFTSGGGSDLNFGVWTATSLGFAAGNVVRPVFAGGSFAYDNRAVILEFDPGTDTIDATAVTHATAPAGNSVATVSITTSGEQDYLLAMWSTQQGFSNGPTGRDSHHWKPLITGSPNTSFNFGGQVGLYYRIVNAPGTYTFSMEMTGVKEYALVLVALTAGQPPPVPKALGNIIDQDSLDLWRTQCRANGLFGSLWMNSQKAASDWLKEIILAGNGAPVWSGFKLKIIPRSEVSTVGNGVVYTSPTAAGPVIDIKQSLLIGDTSTPLITFNRKGQVDANNIQQIEHTNRANDYNVSTVSEPESGGIALYGPRKQGPISLHEIQDAAIARKILSIEVRRFVHLRNGYKFTMMAGLVALEAMDLVTVNDPLLNIVALPVRITSIKENDNFELETEAEPFLYGLNAPNDLEATTAAPNNLDSQIVPADVNVPIIVEVPQRMSASGDPELWLVVSDSDPQFGGYVPYISTDAGASYTALGAVFGNATTGSVTLDWPAAADPDSTNPLEVDLTESLGTLDNYTTDEKDNFVAPSYVAASPSATPTIISADFAGQYNGVDNTVPAGTPKYCVCAIGDVTAQDGDVYFIVVRSRGAMAIFAPIGIPTTPQTLYTYENSAGNFDWRFTDPSALLIPFEPSGNQPVFVIPEASFYYDFAMMVVPVRGAIRVVGSVATPINYQITSAVGASSVSLLANGRTFAYSVSDAVLAIIQINPPTPGNVPLLVAIISGDGTTGADVGNGWTLDFQPPNDFTHSGDFDGISAASQNGATTEPPGADYELMSYETATLTGTYQYTMPATNLRRAVFGRPAPGLGEDHIITSRFAWLNSWAGNPTPPGIGKLKLDPSWIGKDLKFKFAQFNSLGGGLADTAGLTVYDYTPIGLQSGGGSISGGTGTQGQPGQATYQLTGGALSNPTATTIVMAVAQVTFSTGNQGYYDTRTFTIPVPSGPTTYYVTIYDPGQLGDNGTTPTLTAQAQNSSALVGVPGYVYIGSIVVQPAGGGILVTPGGYPADEQILVNGI